VTPGIADVTNMGLHFSGGRCALIHHSWLSPRKIREMTIVGTRKMIVFDDLEPLEKIKIYDSRVDLPVPGEAPYSYHCGDRYVPYVKQEEPLKVECQHFLDCIAQGSRPLSDGRAGAAVVRLLEAASQSLSQHGATVPLDTFRPTQHAPAMAAPPRKAPCPSVAPLQHTVTAPAQAMQLSTVS
jgi:predicted dehydrogenase